MCRADGKPHKRRCRDSYSAEQRAKANALQRVSRWARQYDAAHDRGDLDRAATCEALMDKALAALGQATTTPTPAAPTKAPTFTADNTATWSDQDFETALAANWDDPAAVDQLMYLVDERAARTKADAQAQAAHDKAMAEWMAPWTQPDAITTTTTRTSRRLSASEQARAEYETYVDCQWLQAESDCNGVLLTDEARAKGIDSRTLFSGNINRAMRYASPELQSWWGAHGRLNLSTFRHQMLGRDSDRGAAERSKYETFDNALTW